MSDINEQLHQFILEETGMSKDEFNFDTPLFSEGFIDSFTMTAIIAHIEEVYEVSVPQSEITLENFDTIKNMAAFIAKNRA